MKKHFEKKTNLKNKFNLIIIFLFVFLALLIFDKSLFTFIQSLRNPFCDWFLSIILFFEKDIIYYSFIILFTIIMLLWKEKKLIMPFIISTIFTMLFVLLLKEVIIKPRPFDNFGLKSFPSGHATMAFLPLPFFEKKNFKWFSTFWLFIAILFSFTRVWFGLHYLSDIFFGGFFGYSMSYLFKRLKILKK